MKYEIAVHSYEDAQVLAELLLKNDYIVMLSREEDLYIVNYIWSPNNANRNDVVFMTQENFEDILFRGEKE